METEHKKEDIFEFIKNNPGLSFRQIRFRLEINESTLNKALILLIKSDLVRKKEENKIYFIK